MSDPHASSSPFARNGTITLGYGGSAARRRRCSGSSVPCTAAIVRAADFPDRSDNPFPNNNQAINYIRQTPQIRDVLLSGGDGLLVNDKQLEYIISNLRAIPHVEIIRIGTRAPVVFPQRSTDNLLNTQLPHLPRTRQSGTAQLRRVITTYHEPTYEEPGCPPTCTHTSYEQQGSVGVASHLNDEKLSLEPEGLERGKRRG